MSATTKVWSNNSPPSCEDVDLNGFKEENNNLIVGSGQTLDIGDRQQTHRAVAQYSAAGNFFIDSGAANAYVLSPVAPAIAPAAYTEGMLIRFIPNNPNTLVTSTVNLSGLGVVPITKLGGSVLEIGSLSGYVTLLYNSASARFELIDVLRDNIQFGSFTTGSLGQFITSQVTRPNGLGTDDIMMQFQCRGQNASTEGHWFGGVKRPDGINIVGQGHQAGAVNIDFGMSAPASGDVLFRVGNTSAASQAITVNYLFMRIL